MTTVVLDSKDLVEATQTGIVPVPAGIAEDNASQAAKSGKEAPKVEVKAETKVEEKAADKAAEKVEDPDDIEGEDGLTAREKRDLTGKMQRAIAKRTKALREAEEFATTQYNASKLAEQRAQELAAENASLKAQLKPSKAVDDKEPVRADYKTDQEHWDAMVDFRVDKKMRIAQAEQAQKDAERAQAELKAHAQAKIERAIDLVPDFKEVTESVDVIVPPFVAGYMQDSDMFAELGYHFAKHPEDVERLSKFTDGIKEGSAQFVKAVTRQLVEVGKIESRLSPFSKEKVKSEDAPKAQTAKAESKETGSSPSQPRVAPIIRPLNGGSAPQVEKEEADMNQSEAIIAWQKRHGVKLTARKRH